MLEKFRLLPDVQIEIIEISPQMSEPFTTLNEKEKLEESKSDPVNLMKLSYYQNLQKEEIIKIKKEREDFRNLRQNFEKEAEEINKL